MNQSKIIKAAQSTRSNPIHRLMSPKTTGEQHNQNSGGGDLSHIMNLDYN